MAKKAKPNQKQQAWIDARKRHHLSHAHVQMARKLGMNPAKLGKIDNHRQQLWKLPLPLFIEEIYFKHYGKTRPDTVISIEDRVRAEHKKKEARRDAKLERPDQPTGAATLTHGKRDSAESPDN